MNKYYNTYNQYQGSRYFESPNLKVNNNAFIFNVQPSLSEIERNIYSLDWLIYSLFIFANLEDFGNIDNKEQGPIYEENLRTEQDALNILASDPAMMQLVDDFKTNLQPLITIPDIEQLAIQYGQQLWQQALHYVKNVIPDDRPLYWARLHLRAALRQHDSLKNRPSVLKEIIETLETKSRGYDAIDFSQAPIGAKKVIVTGFDPFFLAKDYEKYGYGIKTNNPSGSTAFSLHGEIIIGNSNDMYVQSIVLPVRFKDFNEKTIENILTKYIQKEDYQHQPNPNKVNILLSLGVGGTDEKILIERYAKNHRNDEAPDNESIYDKKPLSIRLFGKNFYLTKLQWTNIVSNQIDNPIPIYFHFEPDHDDILGKNDYIPATPEEYEDDPANAIPEGKKGTGSDYFCNETFYRIARLREKEGQNSLITGFVHVPMTKRHIGTPDFSIKTNNIINTIKEIIKLSFIIFLILTVSDFNLYSQPGSKALKTYFSFNIFTADSSWITPLSKDFKINIQSCTYSWEKKCKKQPSFFSIKNSKYNNFRWDRDYPGVVKDSNVIGYVPFPHIIEINKKSTNDTMRIKMVNYDYGGFLSKIKQKNIYFKKGLYELNLIRELLLEYGNTECIFNGQYISFNNCISSPFEDWVYFRIFDYYNTNIDSLYIVDVFIKQNKKQLYLIKESKTDSLNKISSCAYFYGDNFYNVQKQCSPSIKSAPFYYICNILSDGETEMIIKKKDELSKVMKLKIIRNDNYQSRRSHGLDLYLNTPFREGSYEINIDSILEQKYNKEYTDMAEKECYYNCDSKRNNFYWDITPSQWLRKDE